MSLKTLAAVLALVAEGAHSTRVSGCGFISPDAYASTASLAAVVSCSATFKVSAREGMSCAQVAAATGMNISIISDLNSKFNCLSDIIPYSTYLCLSDPDTSTSDYTTCTTTYAVSADDSCTAIKSAYGLDDTTFKIMNPSVDCNALSAGMQLCLEATMGSATLECTANEAMEVIQSSKCSLTERVTSDTACLDFVGSFGVSLTDLHDWNSGLNCCSLSQNDTLCVAVGDSSTQVSSKTSTTIVAGSTMSTSVTLLNVGTNFGTTNAPVTTTSATIRSVDSEFVSSTDGFTNGHSSSAVPTETQTSISPTTTVVPVTILPESTFSPNFPTSSATIFQTKTTSAVSTISAAQSTSAFSSTAQASSSMYIVSWNWFTGPTSDCDASITASEYNSGYYAGTQKRSDGTLPCGETGTFTYNGNTVTVTYAWQTTGGSDYHELTAAAFAKLIGSTADVSSSSNAEQFQAAINDPGRIEAACSGVC
ncbi:hypothetical protein HDU83_006455 [Entophlyctis luteolus]|nr:hypothetical protein HDU83_006455 [Entophlyctis luteolus]